jgi:hypothetical protein
MTFLNRAVIPTANGLANLSVPLVGGRENHEVLGQVRIDNSQRWQTRHWRTITSAYRRSPWFEFYEPELESFYSRPYERLVDWNLDLYRWTLRTLKADQEIIMLEQAPAEGTYQSTPACPRPSVFQDESYCGDLRTYSQVFQDRIGFQPNVSILDLLCNEGPAANSLLV